MNEKRTVLYTVRLVGLRIDPLCHVKGEVWVLRGFRSCRVQYRQQPKKKEASSNGWTDGWRWKSPVEAPLSSQLCCCMLLSFVILGQRCEDAQRERRRGGRAAREGKEILHAKWSRQTISYGARFRFSSLLVLVLFRIHPNSLRNI
jgi:hypothetical protein